MRPPLNAPCDYRRRLGTASVLAVATVLFLFTSSLRADIPRMGMATLLVDDRGSQIILNCHFFYQQMPKQFILHEKQDEPISLQTTDPSLLEKYLSDIAVAAFDLKINGQTAQPTVIHFASYANKSCMIILSYAGKPGGEAELRAPILQYFPPNFVLNVRITNAAGTKGAFFGKNLPPVLHFVQGPNRVSLPPGKPFFSKTFTTELGTAWVNYNWILLCVVLLLMRQPRLIVPLIASLVVFWVLLCLASVVLDEKLPVKIPEMVLSLPIVLLCILCVNYQGQVTLLTLVTVMAGGLNACYDIQQIPASDPTQGINALLGLSLGFIGGMLLVLLVLVPLWWECKKYPGFQENWAPKITWAIACLAVFLPLQKWIFG